MQEGNKKSHKNIWRPFESPGRVINDRLSGSDVIDLTVTKSDIKHDHSTSGTHGKVRELHQIHNNLNRRHSLLTDVFKSTEIVSEPIYKQKDENYPFSTENINGSVFTSVSLAPPSRKVESSVSSPYSRRIKRRSIFTKPQIEYLNAEFSKNEYVKSDRAIEISNKLSLHPQVVKTWFQNRRQKLNRQKPHRSKPNANDIKTPKEIPRAYILHNGSYISADKFDNMAES